LSTAALQFGFKPGVGCEDAIFTVNKLIDYFSLNGSTVNLCALDLSKAFDRIDHSALFCKLMDRDIPKEIVFLLHGWYSKSFTTVKWGDAYSKKVKISTGVRQGGILSPLLFAVFVDDVLRKLSKSNLGCFMNGICFNAVMYADDLLLLSISVHDLQLLVDICVAEFDKLGLDINEKKSACLRISPRFKAVTTEVCINKSRIVWGSEIRYLGVNILAGSRFNLNLQPSKQKFFGAVNNIFGKVGLRTSAELLVSLLSSFCVPIMLYGLVSVTLNNHIVKSLDSVWCQALGKIFGTYAKTILNECQFYCGILPLSHRLNLNKINFYSKLRLFTNIHTIICLRMVGQSEYDFLTAKYSVTTFDNRVAIKKKIFANFEESIS